MTDAQRKILAKFVHKELPLNRAIKAALCWIEDMEIALQMAIDHIDSMCSLYADSLMSNRLRTILEAKREASTDDDRSR